MSSALANLAHCQSRLSLLPRFARIT